MKIVFVTQAEPFYIKHFFRAFLGAYPSRDIKGIVIQATLNQGKFSSLLRKVLDFYGLKGFVCMGARYAGIKFTDALGKVFGFRGELSIGQVAGKYGIPVLEYPSVNRKDFLDYLSREGIDLVVSVAASEIFRQEVLNLPRYGCVNIHSARLPEYRGMMPNFWTLYNKEDRAWVTVHKMVEKLDDGPIILQEGFKVAPDESYNSLAKRSKEFAAGLLVKALGLIEQGKVDYLLNDSSKATYYTFPTNEQVREFIKRGGRIV